MAFYKLAQKRQAREQANYAGLVRAAYHASKKEFQRLMRDVNPDG